jgi:hypothetical protein
VWSTRFTVPCDTTQQTREKRHFGRESWQIRVIRYLARDTQHSMTGFASFEEMISDNCSPRPMREAQLNGTIAGKGGKVTNKVLLGRCSWVPADSEATGESAENNAGMDTLRDEV